MTEQEIKYFVETLGKGITSPVAYDTAVVALIPKLENMCEPEFPEAVQWIRDHQMSDGSWGSQKPIHAYGNTLSTFAAIIALKTWNRNNNDCHRIERGEKALNVLAEKLKYEKYESIGYEIIIPSLLKKAVNLGLNITVDKFRTNDMTKSKLNSIKDFFITHGFEKKHTFWYSLEMIEGLTENSGKDLLKFLNINSKMLETNGSVCASPSATAFFLKTMQTVYNTDVKPAYNYLKALIDTNNGGIPTISPSDTFEISWSVSSLIMAGIDPKSVILKSSIDKMLNIWNMFNGMIGCSSYLPPDCDAISMFIYVLKSSNRLSDNELLDPLLTFFNGSYFKCFKGERNPSLSANISAVIALRLFESSPEVKPIIGKLLLWIKTQISCDEFLLQDKWHISPYYSISRAVFALQGLDDVLCEKCVEQLLSKQKSDFGWGISAESSLEETALVSLALCHWFGSKPILMNDNYLNILKSIEKFFNAFKGEKYVDLWIGKVLYCPTTVVDSFIISAKYSLSEIIKHNCVAE